MVQGQQKLSYVRFFLLQYFAQEGQLPASKQQLIAILNKEFGYRFSNSFDLVGYQHDDDKFTLTFLEIATNKEIVINGHI
jgi:hypothetical protein